MISAQARKVEEKRILTKVQSSPKSFATEKVDCELIKSEMGESRLNNYLNSLVSEIINRVSM